VITVVDYGMGNLRNVRRAFEHCGQQVLVSGNVADLEHAEKIVLPGVGAFGEAVRRIDGLGVRNVLLEHARQAKPLLGICLGMQLLFDRSEESHGAAGLGILNGEVRRFPASVKVPHIGWNDVTVSKSSTLFGEERAAAGVFYFVHSYYVSVPDLQTATTEYGISFSSAVEYGNVLGVQFHPEKSQAAGLSLLKRFVEL
jgi:glutamine amidotransferase